MILRVTNLEFVQTCEVQFAFAHSGRFVFESAASKRGKELHTLFESIVRGDLTKVPSHYTTIVNNLRQWWVSKERTVLLQEKRLRVKLGEGIELTGKPDLVVKEDGLVKIVDLKTGQNPETYLYSPQLPLYAILIMLHTSCQVQPRMLAVLGVDGRSYEKDMTLEDITFATKLIEFAVAILERGYFRKGYSCSYCDYFPLCFQIKKHVVTMEDIDKLSLQEVTK